MQPRVILVDDHVMVVEALRTALQPDCDVVATASSGAQLLELMRELPVDCVLLDVQLRECNGLELIGPIRQLQRQARVIMVTVLADPHVAAMALRAGADGFVPKDAPMTELREAIREVLQGHIYVSSWLPRSSHAIGLSARHPGLTRLTERQQQIVMMLGEGRPQAEIAASLGLGPSTITFHKQNIMRVLGFKSPSSLLRFAVLVRVGISASTKRSAHSRRPVVPQP